MKKQWLLIIVAIGVLAAIAYAPKIMPEQKNFICTKKTGKKPPKNIVNFTFIENGNFSKTCTTSIKKKRILKSDCGAIIAAMVQKGFSCKRTRLDLN